MAIDSVHPSAGSYVQEIDLSQRIDAVSTSIGAVVGRISKGPVMVPTLITSIQQYIERFGVPDPRISYVSYCALEFLKESKQLYVVRVVAPDALSAGCYWTVDDVAASEHITRLTNFDSGAVSNTPQGKYDPFNTLGFEPNTPGIENILGFFCAENPGTWNNDLFVRIRPSTKEGVSTPDDPYEFYVDVFVGYTSPRQQPNESFLVSRDFRTNGFNEQMNIEEVINRQSKLVRFVANPYAAEQVKVLSPATCFLGGGTNGSNVTAGQLIQGWNLFLDPENVDVNILMNCGYTDVAVQMNMDEICRSRMDCIAVLDAPSNKQEVASLVAWRRNDLNIDSSYSALYGPDLKIYDKYNDRLLFVPPSGFVGAAYARTDYEFETWFAPAGMTRGNLDVRGARHIYNQGDRDTLISNNINYVRAIPGAGYKIWEADTLQTKASALSNVNVRRLLNFIEKSISITNLYSVFEPNDPILWSQLTEMCNRFLSPIAAARGLYRFEVQCDERNNPPESIAVGNTILDVYLDPVIPAKRIHLNAVLTRTGANFKEIAKALNGG